MSLIYIPITFIYTLSIINLGLLFTKNLSTSTAKKLLGSYAIGALITATIFNLSSLGSFLTPTLMGLWCSFLLTILILNHKALRDTAHQTKSYIFQNLTPSDKFSNILVIITVFLLVMFFLNSATPGRAADAIRYHLPQMKDLIDFSGFHFRPNVHFNFPINFTYLYIPIYYLFDSYGAKIAVTTQILFLILAIIEIYKGMGKDNKLLPIVLLLATPLTLLQSTTVTNDIPLIVFSITGLLFLDDEKDLPLIQKLFISSLCLGLAHGTKYYSFYFGPWYVICLLNLLKINNKSLLQASAYCLLFFTSAFIIACPYYIRNYINTGAPLWPAMIELFSGPENYINEVANRFLKSQAGERSFPFYLSSLKQLITFYLFPSIFWLMSLISLFDKKIQYINLRYGVLSFFLIWAFMNPYLYGRYSIYLVPFLLILSSDLMEKIQDSYPKIIKSGILLYLFIGICINLYYSKDALIFHLTQNEKIYHKATWYYDDFQWMNKNIKLQKGESIIAATSADQTYYLNLPYIKGDPILSAEVPYYELNDISSIQSFMVNRRVKYIFIDTDMMKNSPGKSFYQIVSNSDQFLHVFDKDIELVRGRVRGEVFKGNIQLLKFVSKPQ